MANKRKKIGFIGGFVAASALLVSPLLAQNTLPTGKNITLPALGAQTNVGSLPMNMILTPDGNYAITSDMGFRQSLHAISTVTGKDVSAPLVFGVADAGGSYNSVGLYYGMAIKANGDGNSTLYAAQGANSSIAIVNVSPTGALTQTASIPLQPGDFPAGVALDGRGNLYVANNQFYKGSDPRSATTPGSVIVLNAVTGAEISRFLLISPVGQLNLPTGPALFSPTVFPFAIAALPGGNRVYVSSQRDGAVAVLDTTDPTALKFVTSISTGQHPISLLLNKVGSKLFVANAHSDTVSVVSTATNAVTQTILLQPTGARGLPGVTPTGLALSADETRLGVTLGDMNALALVDTASGGVMGYIPVGWYPTGAVFSPLKKQVLVANAKGTQTRYPNPGYVQFSFNGQYDLNQIEGNVSTIPAPTFAQLARMTRQVLDNNRITATTATPPNPLAPIGLKAGKIKHVIYIVKENRTYDQILGDEPTGNGDPSLVLFGKDVTPNLHALAERFVLLDNFYDCGEASGDGWPWSTGGQANEYVIKNLPYNYSGRGRNYDFEGANNNYPTGGFPALDPYGVSLVPNSPFLDPTTHAAPAIPDVGRAPGGHIWDDVLKNLDLTGTGLTTKYRNYGFFGLFGDNKNTPDGYPADAGLQPAGHDLGGITDIDFRIYDASYPDSEEAQLVQQRIGSSKGLYPKTAYGHYNAPSRFTEWNREFQEMLAADPTGNAVPAFQTVRLMHDHTQGLSAGRHTPRAEVADNDFGVGQLVQAVSKSPVWNSTAIFVIEDDAQDGADHVDGHRSTCYVISPFINRSSVDHTFYNTDSVLKTMELLLGVPPMCQYDAVANPILDFAAAPSANPEAYTATLPDPNILSEIAPSSVASGFLPLEKLCAKMDFVHPDSAPAQLLNEIIWKSVKGIHSKMPAPRHSVLSVLSKASPKSAAHALAKDRDAD